MSVTKHRPGAGARSATAARAADPAIARPKSGPGRLEHRLCVRRAGDDLGDLRALLEAGRILLIPDLEFDTPDPRLFQERADEKAKNISFDPVRGVLKGAAGVSGDEALGAVLASYAEWASKLLSRILPDYGPHLEPGKTSFRPRPAEQAMSPRRDDRRLHVDAFPSQPARGRRILRVFRNINPAGEPRIWQLGEPFADYAARFLPEARRLRPGEGWLLQALGLTKARRTDYDQLMLGIHDAAKASEAYQREAPRETLHFPPGATWILFTDAAPHAALSGCHALEQTFFLPIAAMQAPDTSPLRILETMTGRSLV
jgi:hypothetical protein